MKTFLNASKCALMMAILGFALAGCEEPELAIPGEGEEANGAQPPGAVGLGEAGEAENEVENED